MCVCDLDIKLHCGVIDQGPGLFYWKTLNINIICSVLLEECSAFLLRGLHLPVISLGLEFVLFSVQICS